MSNKLTHAQLADILANFKGTTFISLHTVTPNKGQFKQGQNDSRLGVDKMVNVLGWDAKEITKENEHNYMLTSCSFDVLIERARNKQFDKELEFLGIEVDDFVKSMSFMRKEKYELSERKNGTAVNGYLVESALDGANMINVYPSKKNRQSPTFWVRGNKVDAEVLKPFKSASYGKPCQKQIDFGIKPENIVDIRNVRFENIRHITMNGVRYEIVSE